MMETFSEIASLIGVGALLWVMLYLLLKIIDDIGGNNDND